MRERYIAIAILLVFASAVLADLAPEVYQDLQRKAPEILDIRVLSIDVHRRFAKPPACSFFDFEVIRNVKIEARVIRVVRSAAGLRSGDVIEIKYSSIGRCSGWNGPRSIPLLQRAIGDSPFFPDADAPTFSILLREARRFRWRCRGLSLQLPSLRAVQPN